MANLLPDARGPRAVPETFKYRQPNDRCALAAQAELIRKIRRTCGDSARITKETSKYAIETRDWSVSIRLEQMTPASLTSSDFPRYYNSQWNERKVWFIPDMALLHQDCKQDHVSYASALRSARGRILRGPMCYGANDSDLWIHPMRRIGG